MWSTPFQKRLQIVLCILSDAMQQNKTFKINQLGLIISWKWRIICYKYFVLEEEDAWLTRLLLYSVNIHSSCQSGMDKRERIGYLTNSLQCGGVEEGTSEDLHNQSKIIIHSRQWRQKQSLAKSATNDLLHIKVNKSYGWIPN